MVFDPLPIAGLIHPPKRGFGQYLSAKNLCWVAIVARRRASFESSSSHRIIPMISGFLAS